MSTPEEPQGYDPTLSRDATHSTYAAAVEEEEQNPPAGPGVEQTLNVPPGYGDPQAAKASKTSSNAKAD